MSNFASVALAYPIVCSAIFFYVFCASKYALQRSSDQISALCYGMLYTGASALVIFFAYLPGFIFGLIGTAVSLLLSIRMFLVSRSGPAFNTRPLIIAALFGLSYLAVEHLYAPSDLLDVPSNIFFEQSRPPDDQLPFQFARAILADSPSRTGIDISKWYHSDRPPIQTGFTLAVAPLFAILPEESVYRAISTLLQVSIFVAVAAFCSTIGLARRETDFCLIGLGTTGFIYYNSVYGWPKLLAATFCIIGILPIARALIRQHRVSMSDGILIGAALAMGLLAHGAIGFTLVTMAAFLPLLFFFKTLSFRGILAGASVFVVLLLPWSLYTKFIDPNDGKLIKMHLSAGPWDGNESPLTILKKSYSEISIQDWLAYRVQNLKTLFGNKELDRTSLILLRGVAWDKARPPITGEPAATDTTQLKYDVKSLAMLARIDQREHMFRAFGLWAFIAPVLAILALTRWRRRIGLPLWAVATFVIGNVTVWVCLEFLPGFTLNTHASFAMIVLAFIVFIVGSYRISRSLCFVLLITNGLLTVLVWVSVMPGTMIAPQSSFHLLPLMIAAFSSFLLWRVFRHTSHIGQNNGYSI